MSGSRERPLRIAMVHSYYSSRQPSGENIIVDLQIEALRRAGHEVLVVSRLTDELEKSSIYPLLAGIRVATGRGASPRDEIDRFNPDVVHIHNLFPNYGRTWVTHYASRLVTTLHNYRPICPGGTLFREGKSCTLCPDSHSAVPSIRHACFRDSRAATLPVALGTRFDDDPLLASAVRIITLNDDMLERYAITGVPRERLVTLPNFVKAADQPGEHDGDFWLYVGRLSVEKGILPLVQAWPDGPRLKVVGSGSLADDVTRAAGPTVELLGQRPNTEVRALLASARGLFFPSLWPEGLPTIYLEALSAGLPVVASSESVVARLVQEEGTGFVTSGSVADDIARADSEFPALVPRCRAAYENRYTESAWVAAMEDLYRGVAAGAASSKS
ncbi:MAG: glycosyltransferase family 4 protein [Aeromicrobium sp.]